jgi:hypothetical protein
MSCDVKLSVSTMRGKEREGRAYKEGRKGLRSEI